MRGVFFGTSAFAVPALRAFAARTDCALVVTQPDRPAGRGQRLQPTPVKLAARDAGIATIEPATMRAAIGSLRAIDADLYAVASYGKIVPQAILDLPRLGALNVHPSLLPRYRGATPLQSQLRDGVTLGGVTIIAMDAGMDTGDIVLRAERTIGPSETYGQLHDRFALLGAELLAEACDLERDGRATRTPQAGLDDPASVAATLTRPLSKDDLVVDFAWPARRVVDAIRSLSPQPGARAPLDGEVGLVKILEARAATDPSSDDLALVCGDGAAIVIERLVPPNRAAMTGRAYVAAKRARELAR
ncbi:MAG: methionyl-tRNA formyltransferase [Vulcanimicrobiaceae bacterium]